MLAAFHDEWDAAALETHALRRDLGEARTQLSQALYQHDAACRVIARLLRERDEARAALAEAQRAGGSAPRAGERKRAAPATETGAGGASAAAVASGGGAPAEKRAKAGLTADVLEAMIACNKRLSKNRKKRPAPEGLAAPDDLGAYTLESKFPVHQTTRQGVLALAILPGGGAEGGDLVASGGVDTKVNLSTARGKRAQSLAGHKKKVLDVSFVGSGAASALLASGSADSTCKVWKRAGPVGSAPYFELASTFQDHGAEVTAVCPHPAGDYLATASADGTWGFYDLQAELCLAQMGVGAAGPAFTCGAFHPDGLIWGGGTGGCRGGAGVVQVWDVKTQKKAAEMACSSPPCDVTALSFSENGYYLATAARGEAKVWDLRKLKCIQTLDLPYAADVQCGVAFDHSGAYLGVCGSDARVYGVKQGWGCLATLPGKIPTKKGCTPQVRFGPNARYLAVAAGDHNLRYFASSA